MAARRSLLALVASAAQLATAFDEGGQPLSSVFRAGLEQQRLRALEADGESITIMTVGESGIGKTSLLSSLFRTELVWPEAPEGAVQHISEQTVGFDLDGVPFTANLIDSKGFGDIDPVRGFGLVTKRIDLGLRRTLRQEMRINRLPAPSPAGGAEPAAARPPRSDGVVNGVVDVVLYFFAPHRCKRSDIALLKLLRGKVSVLPLLAKADSMTADELERFRAEVSQSSSQSSP